MPKSVHSSIRKDTEIRVRVSYSYQTQIRALAKSQKKTVSKLMRELLDKEIERTKQAK
jgi:mRNA-degrading endonuclease RelE of RelBE toxin-antitoxin system